MGQARAMFEDFTSISCALCSKICGQKNCSVHKQGCMKRNLYTAEELIKKGWVKKIHYKEEQTMYQYNGIIERVVDGDTVIINFDLGFDVWKKERVRLARINAQELKTEEGKAAKMYVQVFTGENVVIKTRKGTDRYGRYIGEVVISSPDSPNNNANLSDLLVLEKLAEYVKY